MLDFSYVKECQDSFLQLGIPGTSCEIYYQREPVYRYANGFANIATQKPILPDTIFHAFSVTKLVTCTAALQLFERGKFLLDDPIGEYLPEYKQMYVNNEHGGVSIAKTPIRVVNYYATMFTFDCLHMCLTLLCGSSHVIQQLNTVTFYVLSSSGE